MPKNLLWIPLRRRKKHMLRVEKPLHIYVYCHITVLIAYSSHYLHNNLITMVQQFSITRKPLFILTTCRVATQNTCWWFKWNKTNLDITKTREQCIVSLAWWTIINFCYDNSNIYPNRIFTDTHTLHIIATIRWFTITTAAVCVIAQCVHLIKTQNID